jgi:hypothetical protein
VADLGGDDLLARATAALRDSPVGPDPLVAATSALRAVGARPAGPGQVAATRVRINASLAPRRGGRGRARAAVATILATLGTGALSWAAGDDRLARTLAVFVAAHDDAAPPAPAAVAATPRRARAVDEVPAQPAAVAAPEPIPVPIAAEPPPAPVAAPPRPARRPPAPRAATEDTVDRALYRAAHDAHFRGADPVAALATWDAYLTKRPAGRFAIEARYNRGLALVRLGRGDDARAALAPFAEGTIEPAGYRQDDARILLEALERRALKESR